jgi:hypothetical protein
VSVKSVQFVFPKWLMPICAAPHDKGNSRSGRRQQNVNTDSTD